MRPKVGTTDAYDDRLGELKAKRKKLEEEFDKADASGDNRALARIRKELANLDQLISAVEKRANVTVKES
jgi:uncharacterized membrane protein (DUF106 family)